MRVWWAFFFVAALVPAVWMAACSSPTVPSPFASGGGGGSAATGDPFDAGPDADPGLGGPCTSDAQCDDGIECTFDACDLSIERCRFTPDDSQCQNRAYCDGIERCDYVLGCTLGEPVTCSDRSACSIDTCNEDDDTCLTAERDVDEDGDPDYHCGGGDCDDSDATVSSLEPEVCGNDRDDDCDRSVDEGGCASPANDTCFDPLEITEAGSYAMSTVAAEGDYAASCGVESPPAARDVVAGLLLPEGPLVDVQLTARSDDHDVAVALLGLCDQPASEIACSPGYDHPQGGRVAKVRGRSLGSVSEEVALPVYVTTAGGAPITLRYQRLPASTKPANETCGTAEDLTPGVVTTASIVDAASDVATACAAATGELVYRFTLATPQNIDLYATSVDGDGLPVVSLRADACALPSDEITCNVGASSHIFRHGLAAGTYYVAVAATAPTDVLLTLEVSDPTPAPPNEDCASAEVLTPGETIDVPMLGHQDDHTSSCVPGGVDAVYRMELSQASDVLVLARYAQGDAAGVVIADPPCGGEDDERICAISTRSPARARRRNLPAGSYRVLAESPNGVGMQLTLLTRPAVPPTLVPFADACGDVFAIPANGGFFQGTTQNAQAQFSAGCDIGGQPAGGARDQLLSLTLASDKRVVLDMQGSGYATLLSVRGEPPCPGSEVPGGCSAGYEPERSYLDITLEAGTYYLQIDGYSGNAGPWFLDVYVVDP
jgi:hypothetical protein